jgi:hypothetical protein
MDVDIEIDAVIAQVKKAVEVYQGESNEPGIEISRMDLTLKAVTEQTAGGGIKFKIPLIDVELGSKVGIKKGHTQTVELSLVPEETFETFSREEVSQTLLRVLRQIDSSLKNALFAPPRFKLDKGAIELNFVVNKSGEITVLFEGKGEVETTNMLKLHIKAAADES